MLVKPAPGRAIRDPGTMQLVSDDGLEIDPTNLFWARVLGAGDVVDATAPAAPLAATDAAPLTAAPAAPAAAPPPVAPVPAPAPAAPVTPAAPASSGSAAPSKPQGTDA